MSERRVKALFMKAAIFAYPDEISLGGMGGKTIVVLRTLFRELAHNCGGHVDPYGFFEEWGGRVVKEEQRTRIVVWETPYKSFYFKHYFYPGVSRLNTVGDMPKARREYLTLGFLRHLEIPCVEAVGWGARWGRWGEVLKCFILTVREEGAVNFRTWLREGASDPRSRQQVTYILKTLGEHLRNLHTRGFFLLRPNTRNILICPSESSTPSVLFLDQPYARFLKGSGAVWGQLKDLSTLLGGTVRHLGDKVTNAFMEGYLPNPLERTRGDLQRRLWLAIKARESDSRFLEWGYQCRALWPVFKKRGRGKG